ncbi:hypothetical protein B0I35DRAFT_215798 [Stachybotrys elegans]|uniref:Uncharacterized protein n=1 Tax=Stachybotrys elegans TaxID=80388 RepID=A0A8K0WRK0_9HYPO|nr:hypothetical protein B0I35DRAFT_215798 [Stachybotrys elegans]
MPSWFLRLVSLETVVQIKHVRDLTPPRCKSPCHLNTTPTFQPSNFQPPNPRTKQPVGQQNEHSLSDITVSALAAPSQHGQRRPVPAPTFCLPARALDNRSWWMIGARAHPFWKLRKRAGRRWSWTQDDLRPAGSGCGMQTWRSCNPSDLSLTTTIFCKEHQRTYAATWQSQQFSPPCLTQLQAFRKERADRHGRGPAAGRCFKHAQYPAKSTPTMPPDDHHDISRRGPLPASTFQIRTRPACFAFLSPHRRTAHGDGAASSLAGVAWTDIVFSTSAVLPTYTGLAHGDTLRLCL